jgi:hypothetical protein
VAYFFRINGLYRKAGKTSYIALGMEVRVWGIGSRGDGWEGCTSRCRTDRERDSSGLISGSDSPHPDRGSKFHRKWCQRPRKMSFKTLVFGKYSI